MAGYAWTEDLSVDIAEMDRHHIKLFEIMNKLRTSMINGTAGEDVPAILSEILDYTIFHFEKEEQLMASANYGGLDAQKMAHQAFIAKVKEFQAKADQPGMAIFVVIDVFETAGEWLQKHIAIMDKQYGKFLNEAGIR
jgi:hemerythrin-like metal-binding protein